MNRILVAMGIGCLLSPIASGLSIADDGVLFFESKIRPILVDRCLECHNATKSNGGLALDTRAGWQKGGDTGPAIHPGKPDESLLLKAIQYDDENLKMPPEDKGGKLPAAQVALLTEWVKMGAPDPRVPSARIGGMSVTDAKNWWAFKDIVAPRPPQVRDLEQRQAAGIVRHEIDQFIMEKLDAEKLEPSPPADRRTLIRRATYDLTGLPPTLEEVVAFEQDSSPDAFMKVVDRLLESSRYGEHWGRKWLDVVRYADTAGENTDRPIPQMWRYRNWVFDAFSRDMPFDQFVRLQFAGDILRTGQSSGAYGEGVIATGYLAIARRFGHDSDKDIHLMHEDVIDNIGKTFLGMTLACARCHDHKYDPVSMQDYYALYGIFASSRFSFAGCEAKGQPRDLVPMLTPTEADAMRGPWREKMAQSESKLKELSAKLDEDRKRIGSTFNDAKRVLAVADVPESGSVAFADGQKVDLQKITVHRGEVLNLIVSPQGSHGADSTRVEWEIRETAGDSRKWSVHDLIPNLLAGNPWTSAAPGVATWCFLNLAEGLSFLSEKIEIIDGQKELKAWRSGDTPSVFVNTSEEPVKVWTTLPPRAFFVHPGQKGPVAVAWISPIDGEVAIEGRVSDAHPAGGDGVAFSLEHIVASDSGPALTRVGTLSRDQAEMVRRRDAEVGPEPAIPVAFAVIESGAKNAALQLRGDPEKPGPEVPRRWLEAFGGQTVPATSGSGRVELADWILQHPLSTRVIVNRIWQGHFGHGLVRTPNDFGARGDQPTHPELLEWLANAFRENGMHFKAMHRMIMSSAAYQRSSVVSDTLAARDPENHWLARVDRRRMSAEEIRDSLLVVAGNLDTTPGEAHPFPPEKSWTFTQHNPFSAVYDNNKRTAYQMVQRQRRHPFLALFDGADPNASTGIRQTTTAPTQALFFLNDPFFHGQATRLAGLLITEPDESRRLRRLFQITMQREPSEGERERGERFLSEYPGSPQEKWDGLVRVVLASNEFIHVD